MSETPYWHRQSNEQPLFGDLVWSRPEYQALAGKLLIVGGNAYGFAAPADAYRVAMNSGIGTVRVVLPDALRMVVGRTIEAGEFAPSTPSGSLSLKALETLLAQVTWADSVLLAGDLGRNSETAILLEKLAMHYRGQLVLTKDAADYFTRAPQSLLTRQETLAVLTIAQLQRLAMHAAFTAAFTFEMGLPKLVDTLHSFTESYGIHLIVKHLDHIVVGVGGEVSTTPVPQKRDYWRVATATRAAVWWLQNPAKPFDALTTAAYDTSRDMDKQ